VQQHRRLSLVYLVGRAVAVQGRLMEAARLAQETLQAPLHLKEITVAQRALELLEVQAAAVLVR